MKLIPLAHGSKSPLAGEDWHDRISDDPAEHARWLAEGFNVGCPLEENGRSVLDFDGEDHIGGRELAREFYEKYSQLCTCIVETSAGNIHFHFQGKTKTRKLLNESGKEIGDIKGNGYVLWEGSRIKGKVYRILRDGPLPPVSELDKIYLIIEKENNRPAIDEDDPMRRLKRAMAWMKKREGGEDGSGRGLRMIKTCRALFKMFGLTEDQALPLILEFNERACVPPYTEKQLRHKIEDAQKGLT